MAVTDFSSITEIESAFEYLHQSNKALLKTIDTAIYTIAVAGQSYTIGSRRLTRADLADLFAIRTKLAAQVSADEGGDDWTGRTYVADFAMDPR